ncbi:MAG: hypothetical protein M1825_000912 [Sarcosagium campestre]|nr:MAG: hypothetical protein M1825_000912 [Sarcosagium campestre]
MPIIDIGPDDARRLQDVADVLAKSSKVIVVTGAGISTNSGIPDFRSENGLYSLIQAHYDAAAADAAGAAGSQSQPDYLTPASTRETTPAISDDACPPSSQASTSSTSSSRSKLPSNIKGRDLFDALIWSNPLSTSIFYTFIASLRKKIREEVKSATPTHKFVRALRDGGRLVRCYTQNIDGLETREGLCSDLSRGKGNRARFTKKVVAMPRPEGGPMPGSEMDGGCEIVQLHGDLDVLRCGLCNALCSWEDDDSEAQLLQGEAPSCQTCLSKDDDRRSRGKRGTSVGTLRPNIILYGEEHPAANLLAPLPTHDLGLSPDVLLIMGTSLRVHGLKTLVREFAKSVHARKGGKGKVIFVNYTRPSDSLWSDVVDYWVGMDCDAWVEDLRTRRDDLWLRQGELKMPVCKVAGSKSESNAESKPKSKPKPKPASKRIAVDKTIADVKVNVDVFTDADANKENIAPGDEGKEDEPLTRKTKKTKKIVIQSPARRATKAKPRRKASASASASTFASAPCSKSAQQQQEDTLPTSALSDVTAIATAIATATTSIPKATRKPRAKRTTVKPAKMNPPSTPSKQLHFDMAVNGQSLLTPPGSGSGSGRGTPTNNNKSKSKRRSPTPEHEDALLSSPSKRNKQPVLIWQDDNDINNDKDTVDSAPICTLSHQPFSHASLNGDTVATTMSVETSTTLHTAAVVMA